MCIDCFPTEIKKFQNQKQWANFDLELSQKLGQEKLKQIVVFNKKHKDQELYIYQCMACGQKWKLEEPNDHGDGYFIRFSTFENLVTRQSIVRRLAIVIIIVAIILTIARAIFW